MIALLMKVAAVSSCKLLLDSAAIEFFLLIKTDDQQENTFKFQLK